MTLTIALTDVERARIDQAVARLRAAGEVDLTADTFVARMTTKLVRSWLEQDASARVEACVGTVRERLTALPASERASEADKLLAALTPSRR